MSDLYEIFVDGELRVAIYDDFTLAAKVYAGMAYHPDAGEKHFMLVCNGSSAGESLSNKHN